MELIRESHYSPSDPLIVAIDQQIRSLSWYLHIFDILHADYYINLQAMNMEKLLQYYDLGLHVARTIGYRNIAFFGLLGTSIAAK